MSKRHKIRATVESVAGKCNQGHRVGQEFIIGAWTPKGICLSAFGSIYPAIRVLQYNGFFPWDEDPNVTYIPCPDAKNQVKFRLERQEEEA